MTPCTEKDRLIKLELNVGRLVKLIDDSESGHPGLYQTVILLTNNQIKQAESQAMQGENINNLVKSMQTLKEIHIRTDAEDKVISKLAKERQVYKQWVIGLSVTVIIAISGFAISVIT